MKPSIRKVNMAEFTLNPERFELRSGRNSKAPTCAYGNHYQWIGYDKERLEYVRFTKAVFKILVNK